jgi:quercetin dioxygenase-like cupin family protein
MKVEKLNSMIGGWFVGAFEPTLINTNDVEVAVKEYKKGEYEERHYHKIATEITVIVSGKVRMNGVEYNKGDMIVIEPNESTDFEALEDTVNTVVKFPGASDDKYLGVV